MAGKKLASVKVVAYIGTADEREIDNWSWGAVGCPKQQFVKWSKDNGWEIPVSWFTDEALEYCARPGSGFVIKDSKAVSV